MSLAEELCREHDLEKAREFLIDGDSQLLRLFSMKCIAANIPVQPHGKLPLCVEDIAEVLAAYARQYAAGATLAGLMARIKSDNERWWRDPATHQPKERNVGEVLMLMVSELSEAMEGDRKRSHG